uniref:Uncharacterized protein n=1 Tax=Timema tahoe TaxID=61484 RepID=A0A7R9FKE9_9NEOP|nr:unnamed protein product [Timema tahoe]
MAITMAKTSLARDVAAVACGETLSCLWEGVDRAKLINNECLFPVDLLKYPEAQSGLSLHLKQIAGQDKWNQHHEWMQDSHATYGQLVLHDEGYHPYHYVTTQHLLPTDLPHRLYTPGTKSSVSTQNYDLTAFPRESFVQNLALRLWKLLPTENTPECQLFLTLFWNLRCLQSTVLTRKVCVEDVPKVDQEETQDSPCSGAHLLDSSTPKQGTPTLQSEKRCYRHFDVRNEASWVTTHTLDQRGNAWHESAETFSDIIRN